MPLYEYRCEACSAQFEATQSIPDGSKTRNALRAMPGRQPRLLSSFSSTVVGDHKPGFAEIKAAAMNNERMERFAKLPPLNAKRNVPPPNTSFDSNASAGSDSGSEQ